MTPKTESAKTTRWSARDVNDLVESRGRGGGLWHLQGSIVALATGRILANINGIEEVHISQPLRRQSRRRGKKADAANMPSKTLPITENATTTDVKMAPEVTHAAELLVRDSLFYTTESGALMREFRLRPTTVARRVDAVLPGSTRVSIRRREDGSVVLRREGGEDVVAHAETVIRRGTRELGSGLRGILCASWAFIGRRVSTGGATALPGVVERCDYVMGRRNGVWHWSRVGRCPSWYGRGQCVTYLEARKIPTWQLLDERVRGFLEDVGRPPFSGEMPATPQKDGKEKQGPGAEEGLELLARRNGDADTVASTAVGDGGQQNGGKSRQRRRKWFGLF